MNFPLLAIFCLCIASMLVQLTRIWRVGEAQLKFEYSLVLAGLFIGIALGIIICGRAW